jgi:hypothetical protein
MSKTTLITLILIIFYQSQKAQTVLKNIDIISKEQFTVWVYDSLDTTNEWRYHSSNEIYDPVFNVWEYYAEIESFWVNPYAQMEFLFTTCQDTTYVVVYGNPEKTVIKNEVLNLNGKPKQFGNKQKSSNYGNY